MRAADVQLTLPSILVALMVDGVARAVFAGTDIKTDATFAIYVLIFAIGISAWPQYAQGRAVGDAGGEVEGLCCGGAGDRHSRPGASCCVTFCPTRWGRCW